MASRKKLTPLSKEDWEAIADKICAANSLIMEAHNLAYSYDRRAAKEIEKLSRRVNILRDNLDDMVCMQYRDWADATNVFFGKGITRERKWTAFL